MNLATALTTSRIALAPAFFVVFQLSIRGPSWLLVLAWLILLLIELSDLFDGMAARALKQVSELGKILDPFADSVSRLTYFVALSGVGILPLWILLVLIYRDISVAYIRVMVSRSSHLMPARLSGKLKAWVYAVAGIGGVAWYTATKLGWGVSPQGPLHVALLVVFALAAAIAIWSLADYFAFFARNSRRAS